MKQYDTIVIGGGINSLAAAALLAEEGENVILLESQSKTGGLSKNEEFYPGFIFNSIYV